MTAPREFDVTAPDLRRAWLLPGAALLLGLVGVLVAAHEEPRTLWILAVLALAAGLVHLSIARRAVVLEREGLHIRAGINALRVPVDTIDLASAAVIEPAQHPALRPVIKTFGTAMPGYQAGHFRLRDRGRAFVLLTGPGKVLLLPLRDGTRVLLSLRHPESLLQALRDMAPGAARR